MAGTSVAKCVNRAAVIEGSQGWSTGRSTVRNPWIFKTRAAEPCKGHRTRRASRWRAVLSPFQGWNLISE